MTMTDEQIRHAWLTASGSAILPPAWAYEFARALLSANKPAVTPCVHADDPKACYRVRCQLGNKCVDDDMSPRTESAERSTGICFFCSKPMSGAHEADCPQANSIAAAPDRHAILYEAGEALLAAEHHEAYEVLYRMMEECRAASPTVPAQSGKPVANSGPNIEWFRLLRRVRDQITEWSFVTPERASIATERIMRAVEDFIDNDGITLEAWKTKCTTPQPEQALTTRTRALIAEYAQYYHGAKSLKLIPFTFDEYVSKCDAGEL